MVTIYQDYDEEPEDIFEPLPEELACEFYALEMDSFTADINFFEPLLPQGGTILELGCGAGRITGKLTANKGNHRLVIGIDLSMPMLRLALSKRPVCTASPHYCCMDMTRLAFLNKFDAILIPYNTLNLLASKDLIINCLKACKNILHPDGRILLQLFTPTEDFIRRKKSFQFQMFDRPGGGKIIKEILRQYQPHSQKVSIEERFRVRPMQQGVPMEDWSRHYSIVGFSAEQWLDCFNTAGFSPTNLYGDYEGNPYHQATSSSLLAVLTL